MKISTLLFKGILCLAILGIGNLFAQNNQVISFVSGQVKTTSNIDEIIALEKPFQNAELVNGHYYRIVQFNNLPSTAQKAEIKNNGVELLHYVPYNAYYARIASGANLSLLRNYDVSAVLPIEKEYKLTKKLTAKKYEKWALKGSKIQLNTIFFDGLSNQYISDKLNKIGAEVGLISNNNAAHITIEVAQLDQLYSQPYLYFFEQIDPPSEPENLVGVTDHRSNNIANEYASGLHYDGTGITVMLQDNSMLDQHIDYTGRFTDMNATQSGDHGEHCGGTIAAAGNLDPTMRGMAYGADVLVYNWDNNNYNNFVGNLYTNNGLTITSKSYSNGVNAGYTSLAQLLDQQIRTMPNLSHVFSAGNSNGSGSTAAGSQWFNVTGGHKAGKNVITVANLTQNDVINSSSSRGPCADGRIKPDISAVGTSVWSTQDPNNYVAKTGTSMSCPGVAGTIAQLCHAYKDLNGNVDPPSGLIKATILNTADDIGNVGPDFIHGWGRINARRAYSIFDNNTYLSANISQGGNNTHNITVPAGTDQLRVMVLWVDYEGAVSSSPSLVNNININVVDPNSTSYNPWVLNAAPNAVTLNLPAVRGIDNLNNMEQVTIDSPVAGTHTVNVSGFAIPQGPQTYYLVYEFVTDDVVLTYPIGGESFDSSVDEKIRWDAFGNTGTFNIDYSTDNGSTWNTVATNIQATRRYYDWNVPNVVTGQALVRVTRGASSSQSHQPFSIIRVPTGLTVDWVCPTTMQVSWNQVSGATGYEVSLLGNKYMDSVGTAIGGTTTSLIINASASVPHWWSVKALGPNNCVGRRAIAQYQSAGTFNCVLAIDAGVAPLSIANNATINSCPGADIDVVISNNGANTISNVPVHYVLNGAPAVNEVYTGSIAPGNQVNYTFSTQNTPIVGLNNLVVWNDLTGDGNPLNDSIVSQFTYNNAPPQTLPWSEDFETFPLCGTASDCEVEVCDLDNFFVNEPNGSVDDIDWRTDQSGTPSQNTGPGNGGATAQVDFNPGTAIGNYLYTEASGNPICSNKRAEMVTPCIDLTTASVASLTFAYNMYGADMGSLHVDIYYNGSWINNITTPISGNQGQGWTQRTALLTPHLGNIVNLRFRGITGNGWASDIAIDDISVSATTGLEEDVLANNFNIHPNPSKGIFNFEYTGYTNLTAKVMDVNGKVIFERQLNAVDKGIIDLTDYSNGLYIVVLNTENSVVTKKIIKE